MRAFFILFFLFHVELHAASLQKYQEAIRYKYLEEAFEKKSQEELKKFLDAWVEEISPISEEELASTFPFEKFTYEIFDILYTPKDLDKLAKWGEGRGSSVFSKVLSYFGIENQYSKRNKIYAGVKYVLIQGEIDVCFVDELPDEIANSTHYQEYRRLKQNAYSQLRLLDFRPNVVVPGCRSIHLSPQFKHMLNMFLTGRNVPPGQEFGISSSQLDSISAPRLEFLNPQFKVFRTHWGTGWHLETHPLIESITFNREMTKAIVDYRLIYTGGHAFFKRTGSEWKMSISGLRWIE